MAFYKLSTRVPGGLAALPVPAMGLLLFLCSCMSGPEVTKSNFSHTLDSAEVEKIDSVRIELRDSLGVTLHTQTFVPNSGSPILQGTVKIKLPKEYSAVISGFKENALIFKREYQYEGGVQSSGFRNLFEETVPISIDSIPIVTGSVRVDTLRAADTSAVRGQLLFPRLAVAPANATNKSVRFISQNPVLVEVHGIGLLAKGVGVAIVEAVSVDGGAQTAFAVAVHPSTETTATFRDDILPIIREKCNLCHTQGRLDYTDSAVFLAKGHKAVARLQLKPAEVGYMPLNDSLSAPQLQAMLAWLGRHVIRLKSVSTPDVVITLGDTAMPAPQWTPANASNRLFTLASADSTKVMPVDDKLAGTALGSLQVTLTSEDGGFQSKFKASVTVGYKRDIQPIVEAKCTPCHTQGALNYLDSNFFISKGASALDRLQRSPSDTGYMPLGGVLEPVELQRVLAWLDSKLIRVDSLHAGNLNAVVGDTLSPVLTWLPKNASDTNYSLNSADAVRIKIIGKRMVALTAGQAKVEVVARSAVYGKSGQAGKSASFLVNIKPPFISVQSLTAKDVFLFPGDTTDPKLNWIPANASNQEYILTGEDSTGVRLIGNRIYGKAVGSATLTVTAKDGGHKTVFRATVQPIKASSIKVEDMIVNEGASSAPVVAWTPANVSSRSFSLQSLDSSLIQTSGGSFTALKAGIAKVKISSIDGGAVDTFQVTIKSVNVPLLSLAVADTTVLEKTVILPRITWTPANASNQNYTMTSSNPTAVSVVGNSLQTTKADSSLITITSADGGHTDVFMVRVTAIAVPVVDLSVKDTLVARGTTFFPKINWTPALPTNVGHSLSSALPTIAEVVNAGKSISAKAKGEATITITSDDGAISRTFKTTVKVFVNSLNVNNVTVTAGQAQFRPTITWNPGDIANNDPSNTGYTLSSASPGVVSVVASVDQKPYLNPLAAGSSLITITSLDNPAAMDQFTVTVKNPVYPVVSITAADKIVTPKVLAYTYPTIYWNPTYATDQGYILSTSYADIIELSPDLRSFRAKKGGVAYINVKTDDGAKTASFKVTAQWSWSTHVYPIVANKCASCHLSSDTQHDDLLSQSVFTSKKIAIRDRIISTSSPMPPAYSLSGDLTEAEENIILEWISTLP